MLLLPLRRNEAAGLTWSEVDLDQGRVRISAARMKARQLHRAAASKPAFAILAARKLTATGDLVFPSSEGAPFSDWGRLLTHIRAKWAGAEKPGTTVSVFMTFDAASSVISLRLLRTADLTWTCWTKFWPTRAAAYLGPIRNHPDGPSACARLIAGQC